MRYDVAIVIVSTNKLDEDCLVSVRRMMEMSPLRVVFVLVDNASTAFSADVLARRYLERPIVILRQYNAGFGSSCNRGAREVEAGSYFFLNPDTRVADPQLLDKLYEFLRRHPKIGVVAPRIRYPDGRLQETCRRFPEFMTPILQRTNFFSMKTTRRHRHHFLMNDFNHERRRMVDWVQGSAFLIDGPLFHELGGFDERYFMYYEDVDLCRRVWQGGRAVYYLPEAELFHVYGKESARMRSLLHGFAANTKVRAHIMSWLKYAWKWREEIDV